MTVPLALERLRHISSCCDDAAKWKQFKGAVDKIGGMVVQSGLVHALLFALNAPAEKRAPSDAVLKAVREWLCHAKCPARPAITKALLQAAAQDAETLVKALMQETSVRNAMAIQAEVTRYLGEAKLVANAFKDQGESAANETTASPAAGA